MSRTDLFLAVAVVLLLPSFAHAQAPADSRAVAIVDGEKITNEELRQAVGQPLASLEEQVYTLKQQKLEQLIADHLLAQEAKRRKVSVESLVNEEITSKVTAVTPQEVHDFYEANKAQLQQQSESQLQEPIKSYLREQRVAASRLAFVQSLKSRATITTELTRPAVFRASITGTGPDRGAQTARVTIVEFEDFQCPFCRQVHETVERVMARYKDSVRLVHRDLPLQQLHPAARKAHEAARCAEKQGKFWEYRNVLYEKAPAASVDQLNGYAAQLGLNAPAFRKCLDGGEFRDVVQRDEQEAQRLGITGTPAFYINGRFVSGAQPEGEFARIIDEELTKLAAR